MVWNTDSYTNSWSWVTNRFNSWKLQKDSNYRVKKKPKFLDYPISNFDIIKWVKYFNIKNFNGVFSRDNIKGTIKKTECGIINLDDRIGSGTHWVC